MKQISNKDWIALSEQYDWVADMGNVPQDPRHHAEGDVAVHTQLVLQALEGLPEYRRLPGETREVLWMAALLHDVEKRSTTITESDGSIVSPGHAKKGAFTARSILYKDFSFSFQDREQIVNLVRFHGLPLWLMHKPDPLKAMLGASLLTDTRLLALLAKADILGRICEDQEEMLDRIAFFEAYCREQECWGYERKFFNGMSRFHYFHKEHASPEYVPFEDSICEVILMSALPGMGKDHYIRQHYPHLPVISLDDIRRRHKLKPEDRSANGWVAQQAREQARVYLRAKQDFIWNATNITLQMRSQLIGLFSDYKARVKLVYLEKPYPVWQKQNAGRQESIAAPVLDRMLQKLEVPHPWEAHEVHYLCS